MIFHRIAPGWQPTGDTACSVMCHRGVITTVYQPAPRNGPGWTPKEEQTFQQFVTRAQRNAECWNGLAPGASWVRWFHSAPATATIASGQQYGKGGHHVPQTLMAHVVRVLGRRAWRR